MTKSGYYKQNLSLAVPIMLSSLGQSLVQMIDTLMVGRLGTDSLAAISFAGSLTMNALVVGMGIAMALTPLVGQSYARKEQKRISLLTQNALSLNTLIALSLVAFLLILMPFLKYFGQDASVINLCYPYYFIVTLSFIPMMIFLAFKQFMEGIDNTKVAMIITISSNVLNVILNYLLIYGKFGFPFLGLTGAGVATFISRLLAPIAFCIYIKSHAFYSSYMGKFSFRNLSRRLHFILLKTGTPIAIQMFVEMFSLFAITVMMGWVSYKHLAAFQIVNAMISTSFLAASGICSATTVLISHAFGLNDRSEMRKHFFSGWKMVLLIMGTVALIYIFLGRYIAMLFSDDAEVISIAASLFVVAGFFQLFDGTQVSGLAGLRGMNDVWHPMIYALITYFFIAVPLSYCFGFVFKFPPWSIFSSFLIALSIAGLLYHRRFYKMSKEKLEI
ncbi:MAG: MATE family efflux transporter [Bacteroidales bacterium]|nr:MATE family efflux transporter [Bacteroidales bacterium]